MDEVGRGAWAGPLTVGVVVVGASTRTAPVGTADSKALSASQRESLCPRLRRWCVEWSLGEATPDEIDEFGLSTALTMAARRALGALRSCPSALVLDGTYDFVSARTLDAVTTATPLPAEVRTIPRADGRCATVAAASILAKVARDATMTGSAATVPGFGFEQHKGYGTPEHRAAIAVRGLTSVHRRSWAFADPPTALAGASAATGVPSPHE